MNASFERLFDTLAKDDFKFLHKFIDGPQQQELLLRKGVYPYDYVDGPAKLEETQLLPKQEFYSKLYEEGIRDEDYQHAKNVWTTFNCQTLEDYQKIYLRSDVLLLTDVFESFQKMTLATYKLDPAHYFTPPDLCYDAMLKLTGVKLQLVDDPDMYLMVESGN